MLVHAAFSRLVDAREGFHEKGDQSGPIGWPKTENRTDLSSASLDTVTFFLLGLSRSFLPTCSNHSKLIQRDYPR